MTTHIKTHFDSDKQHLNGREGVIERIVQEREPGFDPEVLPMIYVRTVDTNEQLLVFPEELEG